MDLTLGNCRATLAPMSRVTHDGQSFSIDGRRIWLLAGSIHYARVPAEVWEDRIAAAAQAGLNTIETVCPWYLHEPRKGRFSFSGQADVGRFIQLCQEAGLWVILRPGPYVGDHYDAGGLPAWIIEKPDVKLREANEKFLERASLYLRKLMGEVSKLQATEGGPIVLMQSEHAWLCANDVQGDKYLKEITRYLRENGANVPIINTNDLWQESAGTIATWRGSEDLLLHLRQLRSVQNNAPRLVSALESADIQTWGNDTSSEFTPDALQQRIAQVLAAGSQLVISPFHGGTNFDFQGGRAAGGSDQFISTTLAKNAPLGEAGARGEKYNATKRLMTFASNFASVFAELDPQYHPIVLDPVDPKQALNNKSSSKTSASVTVVPQRGAAGRVVFVFGGSKTREVTLLIDQGIRLPVYLGDQSVGWYIFDVDLQGQGRLDYVNICPFALIDRSILVLQGPAKAPVFLSISDSSLQANVPSGKTPLVKRHKNITIIICNQEQIDTAYPDKDSLLVGVAGIDKDGQPLPLEGSTNAMRIGKDGKIVKLDLPKPKAKPKPIKLNDWQGASRCAYIDGSTPKFASLNGPATLAECGASVGYGWYRIQLKTTTTKKHNMHMPMIADRVHLYEDGKFDRTLGFGPGASNTPFEVTIAKGQHTYVALVDNLGRFSAGNDLGEDKGFFGHMLDVKTLKAIKPKKIEAQPVDPFTVRGFIEGCTLGQLSDINQLAWTFMHAKKSSLLLEVKGANSSGTFLLNDKPLGYYAGATGGKQFEVLLQPGVTEQFRRGKNVLRFAPDAIQDGALDELAGATVLYECVDVISEKATWSYAKWDQPRATEYKQLTEEAAKERLGAPCWWRCSFEPPQTQTPIWFDTHGLSKGQVFVNGLDLGRYFTSTAQCEAVGPQTLLYVPTSWVEPGEPNELVIFDEHGFAPHQTRLVFADAGPLD